MNAVATGTITNDAPRYGLTRRVTLTLMSRLWNGSGKP